MNHYPVLRRLCDNRIFGVYPTVDGLFEVCEECDRNFKEFLTTAEVLALADELKAFVAAQTTPAADPLTVTDTDAYAQGAAAFRKIFNLPEPPTSTMAELPSGDPT